MNYYPVSVVKLVEQTLRRSLISSFVRYVATTGNEVNVVKNPDGRQSLVFIDVDHGEDVNYDEFQET